MMHHGGAWGTLDNWFLLDSSQAQPRICCVALGPSLPSLRLFLERGPWEPPSPPQLCGPVTYTPAPGATPRPQPRRPFCTVLLWLLTELRLKALPPEASGPGWELTPTL